MSGDKSYPRSADDGETFVADSVSTAESVTVTEDETITYGRDHDPSIGDSVAIGVGARTLADVNSTVSGDDPRAVHIGFDAGRNSDQFATVATGYRTARNNTGDRVTASGYQAAENNTGDRATASGYRAAENNTGSDVTAPGYQAAENNTGDEVTAVGYRAARNNTGARVTASGYAAAQSNTGDRVTVLGYQAARGDGLGDVSTMGDDNIGIGNSAIRDNQASGLIAIGQDAGRNATTDDQLIITDRNGVRRMVMDLTNGDLSIDGTLTENATL